MALTPSTMLPLGTNAPDFTLTGAEGDNVSLADFADKKALLVMFISNHCPFVKHIANELAKLTDAYQAQGVGTVAIMSNDVANYPDDSPANMQQEKRDRGYNFPYLLDENQSVAKAYKAACTPDFYLFDGDQKLVYRGQHDDSRPNSDTPVTGKDLRAAIDAVLKGKPVPSEQKPSIGCNIKWIKGNEPTYFNA